MTAIQGLGAVDVDVFRHEAFFYAGEREFLAGTSAFIRAGVAGGELVLVALSPGKITLLRDEIGDDADEVTFVDMDQLGRNPACIIPVWRDFAEPALAAGRRVRGIGEPIWPGRGSDELLECHLHEALLNLAFEGGEPWWLLCPYDISGLDPAVVDAARSTHPFVHETGRTSTSAVYDGADDSVLTSLEAPLPAPPADAELVGFNAQRLSSIREVVERLGAAAGLPPSRLSEVMLAVHEAATNSIRHGGGAGTLRSWRQGGSVVFEVTDAGRVAEVLVGRRRPHPDQEGGRGLWLINQLCDLVQVRSTAAGTTVRMHVRPD